MEYFERRYSVRARQGRIERPALTSLSALLIGLRRRRADHDAVLNIRTACLFRNTGFSQSGKMRCREPGLISVPSTSRRVLSTLFILVIVRYSPTTMTPLAVGRDHGWLMPSAFTLKSLALLAGSAATKYSTDDLTGRKMTPSCPCQNNTPHQTRCTDDICCCCTKGIQRHMTCGAKRGLHRGRRRDAH